MLRTKPVLHVGNTVVEVQNVVVQLLNLQLIYTVHSVFSSFNAGMSLS